MSITFAKKIKFFFINFFNSFKSPFFSHIC
ncbi:hypothetical protein PEPE_1435 [Pediococcus pentosaceus ATCC 25745]|uniref:Uncharacterized protein n=1 Tax=Pediococcus pentosaceus (strain ATCC 25745 / CCUG 21536 / LMG 10740 / 183-1w) TaxID=278197 RepID=Q03EA6_PEDPA|nr:hypothetical protein PEPE_1435 [Pediococcus pentosaceus ATCC 25745]